jgi:hypothetical protein
VVQIGKGLEFGVNGTCKKEGLLSTASEREGLLSERFRQKQNCGVFGDCIQSFLGKTSSV